MRRLRGRVPAVLALMSKSVMMMMSISVEMVRPKSLKRQKINQLMRSRTVKQLMKNRIVKLNLSKLTQTRGQRRWTKLVMRMHWKSQKSCIVGVEKSLKKLLFLLKILSQTRMQGVITKLIKILNMSASNKLRNRALSK